MPKIQSPLRYPGGKTRAIAQISPFIPGKFEEYREPFIGGGSFFIHLKQKFPEVRFWINDINPELYFFWKHIQIDSEMLAREVLKIKKNDTNGRNLFDRLVAMDAQKLSEIERAVRFFVLNRITFSGLVEAGGFSQQAFEGRFTQSAVERVAQMGELLQGVKITNLDYRQLLNNDSKTIFTFLDPPYLVATKSKLYGKNGILHTDFSHEDFAQAMKTCKHSWLITYDDSPEIRNNFKFAHIHEWELQYGMNNYKQGKAEKGKELFIYNYKK
ncbi:MAG: DNA adenine methylase [Anaerolineales bacterium]|jgi:DNA adenine methylase|uniref:DNA adenine methylase n=1 Tax=Candidatus Villigracilis vicinus TaxID=3140679 RepID=UPI00313639D4|nr:DNA adenine methylase [Anaerolineales bacterium]